MKFCYFSQLWPKPAFSAAHERTFGILERLILNQSKIYYCCPQDIKKATHVKEYMEIRCYNADPSNTSRMDHIFQRIHAPTAAFFDTFVSENLYSHYVHQSFPNAIKVLDLQDLHSLRISRGEKVQQNQLQNKEVLQCSELISDKEMVSIIRSDLIIACSDYEVLFLKKMGVSQKQIALLTFFYPMTRQLDENEIQLEKMKLEHNRRKHFVFLGNMSHKPNLDSITYLRDHIWPLIHKALPQAQLHVYGSNFPQELSTNLDEGFICKGLMKDIDQLAKYRAMLAPLRFGAGVKGKITDSWREKLPVITTPIGAEGLFLESTEALQYAVVNNIHSNFYTDLEVDRLDSTLYQENLKIQNQMENYYNYEDPTLGDKLTFGGSFNNWNNEEFADAAIKIFSNEDAWQIAVEKGTRILNYRMDSLVNEKLMMKTISQLQSNLGQLRKKDMLQRLTWSESLRSNYHFAKYLDEKRKNSELLKGFEKNK